MLVQGCSNFMIRGPYNPSTAVPLSSGFHGKGHTCSNCRYQASTSGNMIRIQSSNNFVMSNLALIDTPRFFVNIEPRPGVKATNTKPARDEGPPCENGELHNLRIWGQQNGMTDGIDIHGNNIHVHDVMVTNKDECVTVKSPSNNVMVERVFCAWSGGSAIGSLGGDVKISNVHYKNIYTMGGNQAFMIKSEADSRPFGSVTNVTLENFLTYDSAYGFNFDSRWDQSNAKYNRTAWGVKFSNLRLGNWYGNIKFTQRCNKGKCQNEYRSVIDMDRTLTKQNDDIKFYNFGMTQDDNTRPTFHCYNSQDCPASYFSGTTTFAATLSTLPKLPASITGFAAGTRLGCKLAIAFPTTQTFAPTLFPGMGATPSPGWYGYPV